MKNSNYKTRLTDMQTKLIKNLAILAIAVFSASSSFGVVALTNPGFESGAVSPWAPEGSTTIGVSTTNVFAGSQSARVDFPAADGSGIHQDIAISPGDRLQTYTVSFKVLATGLAQAVGVRVGLWENGPSGWVFNQSDYTWIPAGSNGWIAVSSTFTTTSTDATVFRAVLTTYPQGNPKISGSLWVDNASLQLYVPMPVALANPDFENPTINPWLPNSTTISINTNVNQVWTGLQSCRVNFGGVDYSGITQTMTPLPSDLLKDYTARVQVLVTNMPGSVIARLVLFEWSSTTGYTFHVGGWYSIPANNTSWLTMTENFTMTDSNASSFQFGVQFAGPAGTFWVDNASFQRSPMLANPGFEEPVITPWVAEGAATIGLSTTNVCSGSHSVRVDFPAADFTGVHQDIAISPGDRLQKYTVSFKVLATGLTAPVGVKVGLWENGPSGWVFNQSDYTWIPAGSNGWVTLSAAFTTTSSDATIYRAVLTTYPQGSPKISGSLWVDDAILFHGETAANADSLSWGRGASQKNISIVDLLANDITPAGYTLTLVGVDQYSANGVILTINGSSIEYPDALTANDSFNYAISDGHGGTARALVSITATNSYGQSGAITATPTNATAIFYGIPGTNYYVMRATNVLFTLGISNFPSGPAATNGVVQVLDDFADLPIMPASAFYRLVVP